MVFKTNTELHGFPAISQKLLVTSPGEQSLSSGFVVKYRGTDWLITCWHSLGPNKPGKIGDLSGDLTATHISFVNPATIDLYLKSRAVIGVRKGAVHADIAAIQLHEGEKPDMPAFDADITMDLNGFDFPTHASVGGYGTLDVVKVPIKDHYVWQGFPGEDIVAAPRTFRAADFPESIAQHPWMIKYTPSAYEGASGCPVFKLEGNVIRLVGVQVHKYMAQLEFDGLLNDTAVSVKASAEMEWGGAVPIEYIYRSIDNWLETGETIGNIS